MLTKNLLKNTIRQGKVFPKYINPGQDEAQSLAQQMLSVFASSVGESVKELETTLKNFNSNPISEGFKKLLMDSCEFSDEGFATVEEKRWQLLQRSKQIRATYQFARKEQFFELLAEGQDIKKLQECIYSDLPHNRRLTTFKSMDPEQLIHRYNAAQIQGLLLFAKKVTCKVYQLSLVEKRRLMQKIKFHGLLVDTNAFIGDTEPLTFELSGPLSIYEGASTYGGRLANFFPHLLHFNKWDMVAAIKLNQKILNLELNHKKKIRSHYKALTGYIPEEFSSFMENFNSKMDGKNGSWKVSLCNDFIHLGGNDYSFPDFVFEGSQGRKRYLELFHRWHSSAIKRRLRSVANQSSTLILGVCRSILKDIKTKEMMQQASENKIKIVTYTGFPTVKALLTYLD